MPYITSARKLEIDMFGIDEVENAGELNYFITKSLIAYFKKNGGRYQQINDITGALVNADKEFTRRIVVPYEKKKILENGDVY